MNEDTRTLIEMSLRVRSIEETADLCSRAFADQGITVEQISRIRKTMVSNAELSPLGIIPSHARDIEPEGNGAQRAFEVAAREGSNRLLERQLQTGQYFGQARDAWLRKHAA